MNFNGHYLINNIDISKKVIEYIHIYIHIYIYIYIYIYYIYFLHISSTDFTLKNWSFGYLNLTNNSDPDKYKYSGYAIGFDHRSKFLFTDGSIGKILLFLELI